MDDHTRDELLAELSAARAREAQALEQLKAHSVTIEEVRTALGNPYFYTDRSADDAESRDHYSGYRSHEPALKLLREYQEITGEIASITHRLREAGVDAK